MKPTKNIKAYNIPKLALLAGIFSAIAWSVGDMLLVGYVPDPEAYPLLSKTLAAHLDSDFALMMVEGHSAIQRWGIFLATFTVAGYLYALLAIRALLAPGTMRTIIITLLLFHYALSPLGHAGFYFAGETYKLLLASSSTSSSAILKMANDFYTILLWHWSCSLTCAALGWLLFAIQVYRRRSILPRWMTLVNPLPLSLIIAGICSLFPSSQLATNIGSATFNLAALIFFTGVWMFVVSGHDITTPPETQS
ncbi:hypothetical protein KRX19_01720 [Cardiobacteriaceae bacterium TAE3-ERU3]|nr:hypothetical protein [Cardiobacteriaceae bacterium TAE3-ERU3]